jgi:hypothetical protein
VSADPGAPSPAPAGEPIDPLARAAALSIAWARIGIGIGTFGVTRPALAKLGFARPDTATVALARLAGGRDIALGLQALSAAADRDRLREATLLGALVDAGDAIAFGAASLAPEARRTGLQNAALGTAAAIAGAWVLARL